MQNPAELAVLASLGLFAGLVVCLEAGYRIGRCLSERNETAHEGTGTIEAAVFALLGLLLGFSYAGGISHLDQRRELIVREANAIGTAYHRWICCKIAGNSRCAVYFANISTPGLAYMKNFPIRTLPDRN